MTVRFWPFTTALMVGVVAFWAMPQGPMWREIAAFVLAGAYVRLSDKALS